MGFVATVTSTLQYTNNEEEECPVEVIFVFSLPAEAAVCHFSAKIYGEEVVAELHERVRVDNAVWVTIVALIWLHSFKKPEQEEWKFIAIKATSWSRSRKATEYQQQKHLVGKLSECIQAGKALLESEVKEENLGL
ncbi:uncharacterized protein [Hoplias malabaricus]|uniref:uncharacterized protein isoform X1 n=1 Tax=Hoplias malabaricus TaxID=27720 RepID=UPI0034632E26